MAYREKYVTPGDLIEVDRGLYRHWAVYVGDGFVVHLVPPSEYAGAGSGSLMSALTDKAKVKKDKLADVVGNDQWRINNLLDKQYLPRPGPEIVKEAFKFVGTVLPYSITSQNCEHFVTELRYGKAESRQVQVAVGALAGIGLCTAVVFGAAFLLKSLGGEEDNKNKK